MPPKTSNIRTEQKMRALFIVFSPSLARIHYFYAFRSIYPNRNQVWFVFLFYCKIAVNLISRGVRPVTITNVQDLTYHDLSKAAYGKAGAVSMIYPGGEQKWKPIKGKQFKLHDENTGFDATVYMNKDIKQIVIAYRGTSDIKDLKTDIHDVVLGEIKTNQDELKKIENGNIHPFLKNDPRYKENIIREIDNNQFTQADQLAIDVKDYMKQHKDLKGYEISTTGHSLGGAEAEYVAVKHSFKAVTWNAPDITHILPDKLQQNVHKGKYTNQIISYVNPKDVIGSGSFKEYESHTGQTVYINEDFDVANSQDSNTFSRFLNSIITSRGGYHLMKTAGFSFDDYGNLKNILINGGTGKVLMQSPNFQNPFMETDDVTAISVGDGSSKEIKLTPSKIKELGKIFQEIGEKGAQSLPATIEEVVEGSKYATNPYTMNIQSILNRTGQILHSLHEFYQQDLRNTGEFIEKKATDFVEADASVANRIKK